MLPYLIDKCSPLTVCSKCKKNLEEHYIGYSMTGRHSPNGNSEVIMNGRSYCDANQQQEYKPMDNLELVEYHAARYRNENL